MDSFVLVRYGLRCTAFWLALTWLVITGVVLLGDIFEIIRRSSGFTPFSHAIKLACIKIPIHTDYFLPFITFIAARITLWRFDKKNESTALAAVGVSRFFWLRSWGILALVLGGLHLIVLQPIVLVCIKSGLSMRKSGFIIKRRIALPSSHQGYG